jgi:hypothetical protein
MQSIPLLVVRGNESLKFEPMLKRHNPQIPLFKERESKTIAEPQPLIG